MAFEDLTSDPPAPLHPLLGDKEHNELAAAELRSHQQADHRANYRAWTGLYQYELRQARTAALPLEERERKAAQETINNAVQTLANTINEEVLSSNQDRLNAEGWNAPLEPLASGMTAQPISLFPQTLPELYQVDEPELNRMLWHLGIARFVPPPTPPIEDVLGNWRIRNTPVSNIQAESAIEDKQHWIRSRWVGDVKYGRCTLRDCLAAADPPITRSH